MFNYRINSVSRINFLRCHRSEALKLQSAINGREFVSVMAATNMRKRKAGNETIKYTYRAERLPGYRGGKLRRWRMLELVHAVMQLQSSEVGLRAEHIPRLPGRCCDIKPSSTHNACSSCPRQFVALSSLKWLRLEPWPSAESAVSRCKAAVWKWILRFSNVRGICHVLF